MAAALALVSAAGSVIPAQAATPAQTVVSLTFDDANADQLPAAAELNSRGMAGTFYINSGSVGQSGYLTRSDLSSLYAAGNEIGGHTVNHPDLTTLPASEVKQQICLDRDNLLGWGFPVRSFAFPFASTTAAIDQTAADCGYNSARGLGDLKSRFGCADCQSAESIPPGNAFETKALDEVDNTWTLADFEGAVTAAEATGGWVQFTFHNYCGSVCSELSVTSSIFTQFLDWLKLRAASNNTIVKTVGDVVGGAVKPAVTADVVAPPVTDASGLQNSSFETSAGTMPACWQEAGFGANTATYDTVSPGRTGAVAARLTMTAYTDGDAKILPSLDLGSCSPAATPGTSYALSGWYTSTVQTQFEVYLRTTEGAWVYWDASPHFAAATAYSRATWITSPVPAGYTGISFGLTLAEVGTITVDDLALGNADQVPVSTATISPAAPDGAAGWYLAAPTVTLAGSLAAIPTTLQYSTDGTTWSAYSAPITAPVGTSTVSYRSVTSRQTEATRTVTIKVDTDKPKVTAIYDDTARTIAVAATDATSGVATVEQRIAGGAWTAYTGDGPAGDAARAIDYRATDVAGNVSEISSISVPAAPVIVAPPVEVKPPAEVAPPVAVTPPAGLAISTVAVSVASRSSFGSKHPVIVRVAAGAVAPTGTVALSLDGRVVAHATLVAGLAKIVVPSSTRVGKHSLTATYAGDAATASGTSAPRSLTITAARAAVKVTLSKKKAIAHSSTVAVTVTASIRASSLKPTGKVTVLVDGKAVKSSPLTAGKHGRVTITLPRFASTGAHSVRARLSGSAQVMTTTSTAHRLTVRAS